MRYTVLIMLLGLQGHFNFTWGQFNNNSPEMGNLFIDGAQFRVGLQLSDQFMIGGQIPSRYSSSLDILNEGLGAFTRYYLNGSQNRWRPYGQLGIYAEASGNIDWTLETTLGLEYNVGRGITLNNELTRRSYLGDVTDIDQNRWRVRGFLGTRRYGKNTSSAYSKGDLLISSQLYEINLPSNFSSFDNYFNLQIEPSLLYALSDRWMLAADIDIDASSYSQSEEDFRSISAGTYVGLRYLLLPEKRIKPYVSAGVNYEFTHRVWPDRMNVPGSSFTKHSVRPEIGVGLLVPLGNSLNLDLNLGFGPNDGLNARWGMRGGIGLKIGF
ncbi:MAG: hypothetical protein AAFR97_12005 [Bacteroidota bacterium]